MPVDIGTGASIVFTASTAFTAQYTNISWNGPTRAVIQTSHLGTTTAHAFTHGDLYDPGEATFSMWWDINKTPPFTGSGSTLGAITVTLPVPSGSTVAGTWACAGFVTGVTNEIPLEDMMTAEVTVKFSGVITATSATT